ncbi:MAG: DUF998 domain-containing protein [Candidatus Hodarchaeota archaeon]
MEVIHISRLQKASAIFGIVGPVINAMVFTILGYVYPGYNPISQFISELATPEAPHNTIMNILGFVVFGFYLIFFGIGLYLSVKKHILTTICMILFILSGICIFALSMFPCDVGCRNETFTGIGHNLLILFPTYAMPIAMILSVYPVFIDLTLVNGLVQRLGLSVPLSWIFIMSIKIYRLAD